MIVRNRRRFILGSAGLSAGLAAGTFAGPVLGQPKKKMHFGVGPLLPNPEDTKKAYTPGTPPTYIDGIPIIKDQAYIGDFETRFKDLAIYGELEWHVTSAWSITGGTRAFKQTVNQAQQTGLLFDGPGFAASVRKSSNST